MSMRALFVIVTVLALGLPAAASIRAIQVPDGGQCPSVVYASGVLHLAYGKDGNAYYARSEDDGRAFSTPVRLNRREGTVTVGGERGPRIALGKAGVIHVLWLGHYQKGGGIWYTRSTDAGKTFAPERNLLDREVGIDGGTIAADATGHVFAFWIDGRLGPDKESPVAGPIFMSRSNDGGATWSANERVKYDFPGRACSCCSLAAQVTSDGFLYVAFRTGYHNVRDIYLLRDRESENDFHATRVSSDNWVLEGCPMMGPHFSVDSSDRIVVGWMSNGRAYLSRSSPDGPFGQRIPAPQSAVAQRYPTVIAYGARDAVLLWKQADSIRAERLGSDGASPESMGPVAESANSGAFAAFVDRRGDVCVIP